MSARLMDVLETTGVAGFAGRPPHQVEPLTQDQYEARKAAIRPVRANWYCPGAPPYCFVVEVGPPPDGIPGHGMVLMRRGKPWIMDFDQATYFAEQLRINKAAPETDIFRHVEDLAATSRIQIVAPGPRGRDHHRSLDPDCFTIVTNKACEIPGIRKDLWMVADSNAHVFKDTRTAWFQYGLTHCWDIACFDSGYLRERYPRVPYTFEWGPLMAQGWCVPLPMVLRGGITIAGQAIQLAYWLDATEIVLCGVDLTDDEYFDGTSSYVPNRQGGAWSWVVPRFQEFCDWLFRKGVYVSSLSETALKLRPYQHKRGFTHGRQ